MKHNLSAAILCGGHSSRMGFDKAFLRLDKGRGPYLIELVSRQLLKRFNEVLLVANKADKFDKFDGLRQCRVISDIYPQGGPLGAIYTAIHLCSGPGVFILPCDMVNIPWPLMDHVCLGEAVESQARVTVHDGFVEPLFSLYFKTAESCFLKAIEKGEKKIRRVYDYLRVDYVDVRVAGAEGFCFENINSPEDLKKIDSAGCI